MNRIKLLPIIALTGAFFSASSYSAHIRDFQTTRLNSTAGAGVASLLSTEAAILNPATSTFFDGNSASYQSYTTALQHKNTARDAAGDSFARQNRSQGLFVSDSDSAIKGGVAYLTQKENNFQRDRMVFHGSSSMGQKSSVGFSYNYIQDKLPKNASDRHQLQHVVNLGLLHILDEHTSVGLIVTDVTRTTPGQEQATAGIQYQIASRIVMMGDIGAQYTRSLSDNYLWRAAVQLNVFDDLFVRVGKFHENGTKTKGTGWGASWIGPKLGVEFAQKISDYYGQSYVYKDEKLVDTSLSLIIKF